MVFEKGEIIQMQNKNYKILTIDENKEGLRTIINLELLSLDEADFKIKIKI
ncbi:MAG: hypothetical protein Q8M06_11790 [Methanobacteriaceae archaeon]|jgi:hypothetical protein|nr:hypothetical protein [Methanobacteriaceae archaeon]MDZ4170591.1 hypothetical protein [Methanobacteriaceae archaeon]